MFRWAGNIESKIAERYNLTPGVTDRANSQDHILIPRADCGGRGLVRIDHSSIKL